VAGALTPEDEQQPMVLLRGNVQAPQFGAAGLRQPGQHGGHLGTTQGLFGCPEPRRGLRSVHTQQALARQALGGQAWPEGREGRADQQHRPGLRAHRPDQCRQNQLPGMLPGLCLQHLDHAIQRPAAARQLRIEHRMAGGQHGLRRGEFVHPPHMG
jgi:hypothetical protein